MRFFVSLYPKKVLTHRMFWPIFLIRKEMKMTKKNKTKRPYIRIYADQEIFNEAQQILKSINLTINQVMAMLCDQIVIQRKIPFEIKAKENKEVE